jgi:hypothetical protein
MPQTQYLSIAVNVLAAAGDILIAAALCRLLYLSRTGFKRCLCPRTVRKSYTYLFIRTDTMIHKLVSGTFELSPCSFFKQRLPTTSSFNGTGTYFTLLLTRCYSRSTLESSLGIYLIFAFLRQRAHSLRFVIIRSLPQFLCFRFSYHCKLPFLLAFSPPSDLPTSFLVPDFIAIPSHRSSLAGNTWVYIAFYFASAVVSPLFPPPFSFSLHQC